ncbi:PLP-dependent aminotransferase family protein [Zavarzinia sp. CC-PAN008]|uniref:MocR-like pyridoxine biosynthesis transcription factor PdxR n=1 Tax=Zavarzinia sp. CC-PAN008 TaxID=3243332 RepID=UPI003F74571A
MDEAAVELDLLVLDRDGGRSLNLQIYDGLRRAILDGHLRSRARLPPSRALARHLGVGRNTVMAAYAQLADEGYVTGAAGGGTRVAPMAARPLPRDGTGGAAGAAALSRRGATIAGEARPLRPQMAFAPGVPALDRFPRALWSRLAARGLADLAPSDLAYSQFGGLPALRRAIVEHLGAARGVVADPEQVIVTTGTQATLSLLATLLADPGDTVWLEEPGYRGARVAFLGAGLALAPVAVDGQGLDAAAGLRTGTRPRLIYLTPSHQYPLGMTMSLERRLEVLAAAERLGAWIVEDDFDSEFRHAGRPLSALQGLDAHGRTLYLGTFAKTLAPGLRAAYCVVPPGLVDAFRVASGHLGHVVAMPVQATLALFLGEGHYALHIRRMRALYAERAEALRATIGATLGGRLDLLPSAIGMQVAGRLSPADSDDRAVERAAAAAGLVVPALSRTWTGPAGWPGVQLGFGAVEVEAMPQAVGRLARILEGDLRAR